MTQLALLNSTSVSATTYLAGSIHDDVNTSLIAQLRDAGAVFVALPNPIIEGASAKAIARAAEGASTAELDAIMIAPLSQMSLTATLVALAVSSPYLPLAASDITPSALASGQTQDYNPTGFANAYAIRQDVSSSGSTLGGLALGVHGRRVLILNISSISFLRINHEDPNSTASNRFLCPSGIPAILPPFGSTTLWYDGPVSRWRVLTQSPRIEVIHVFFAAAAPGVADDVVIFNANAPFPFRVLDSEVIISTTVLLATVQLRDATGGGGNTLSDAFSTTAVARLRDTILGIGSSTKTIAAGGTLVLRRSNRGAGGEVIVWIQKE